MIEVGRRLGLATKPGQVGGTRQVAPQEHLDRDGATEAQLDSAVDDAHATATDFLHQFVVAERRR